MDFLLIFGLIEAIDQLAMVNSVRRHGNVLRMECDNVLGRALEFDIEGQRKSEKDMMEPG